MAYNDPCANDPDHPPAVVGIGGGTTHASKWVCQGCFDEYLKSIGEKIDRARISPPKG